MSFKFRTSSVALVLHFLCILVSSELDLIASNFVALNSLGCADVLLRNSSLTRAEFGA